MEPPKVSHKKKTDRERDKERAEREMVQEAGRRWREDQLAAGRPVDPREPLKRTAWNNWMHVNCAVWTKEIRFGDAEHLDAAEGVGFIPKERFEAACKFCKDTGFPTVSCQSPSCNVNFHVGCAHQHGYTLGFDISPVKMSRRDSVAVMKLDSEVGLAVPGIWCPHHAVPTIVHNMLEMTPSGLTALQQFAQTYKQVDTSITGTVRRAAQFIQSAPTLSNAVQPSHRRVSTLNGNAASSTLVEAVTGHDVRSSPSPLSPHINGDNHEASIHSITQGSRTVVKSDKKCCSCLIATSPKWWLVDAHLVSKPTVPETQTSTFQQPAELAPLGQSSSVQPPSPLLQQQNPITQPLAPSSASNIKAEPMDVDAIDVPEELHYQCHKCHVQKKTLSSSPSQVKQSEQHAAENGQDMTTHQPNIGPSHINGLPFAPALDGQGHAHPMVNGAGLPPQAWQNGASPWPGPPLRTGGPPAQHAPIMYGAPPPYHPARPGEFSGYPFPSPPIHYPMPSVLPPPSVRPQLNGLPHNSPPPPPPPVAAFAYPLSGAPLPGVPANQSASPHMTPAGPGQRPYSFDGAHRPADSPNMSYNRPYHPLPPAPGRVPSGSADQVDQGRRPSITGESPRLRYEGNGREETPIMLDGPVAPRDGDGRSSTAGPGASASPSLRNLLI